MSDSKTDSKTDPKSPQSGPNSASFSASALEERIQKIQSQSIGDFQAATSTTGLYDLKVKYLGKSGDMTLVMRDLQGLSKEDRPRFGKIVNEAKARMEAIYAESEARLKTQELNQKLLSEKLDLTLPGPQRSRGAKHPITRVLHEMVAIFGRLGYSVRTGPLIEQDLYNFERLNIPKDHPARDMQDTFYIDAHHVLRTQTSPIQIHTMETEAPPFRILGPGAVFRCDSDISHSPMFHQVEGMLVEKKVSMSDLKGTLTFFSREFFGKNAKTRFRPSFFPFTEPSAEVDCTCPHCQGKGCRMCSNSGWIEIGGCGLVHPNVLRSSGIDPDQWQGFAFGFGVERMAIVKYGIEDIRLFFENDVRFLGQFEL